MEIKRSNHILGLKTQTGEVIGFHASNLEVAELSSEAWETLSNPLADRDAAEQLEEWNSEVSPDVKPEPTKTKIQSLSINVTQLCNLHCVYCAAGGDGTYGSPQKRISVEKTIPQIGILMDRLSKGESFSITFLGGEPLLYPQGIKLLGEYALEKAREKNIKVEFNTITNGTLLTEENIEVLRSIGSRISISLDGPAEVNDVVRPSKGPKKTTEQIVEGIKRLNQNRNGLGSIGVQGVFGPYNASPLRSYLFYRELGVDWFDFHYDQENSDLEASNQYIRELAEAGQIAMADEGEKGLRKIKFFDQLFHQLDTKSRLENFCGSGKSYIVLDAQNRAFTCPWAVNNANESVGFGINLDIEKLQPIKNSLLSTNNCNECWARYLCGGGCMWAHKKATGDQHKVDIVYCDRTRALISKGISYYYHLRKV